MFSHNKSASQGKNEKRFRNELKYECSEAELQMLAVRLRGIMARDPHADPEGKYLIRSIYFDDPYNTCLHENENGTDPREKWRIRAYNLNPDSCSLECKRKEAGMIRKISCRLSREQARILAGLQRSRIAVSGENAPLLNRFILLQRTRLFTPKVIVCYEREPFVYPEGNVRVTFDRHIASAKDIGRFFDPALPCRPVQLNGRQLLEVKYNDFLPDVIYHAVQMTSMRRIAFSKYDLCRRYALWPALSEV